MLHNIWVQIGLGLLCSVGFWIIWCSLLVRMLVSAAVNIGGQVKAAERRTEGL